MMLGKEKRPPELIRRLGIHAYGLLLSFSHEWLDIGIERGIADDCDVELHILVETQRALDGSDYPRLVVAERSATKQRKEQPVTPMALCIQDRHTNRCLIRRLKNKPCERLRTPLNADA